MATPGHTPACSTYVIGDACFVGDTLFMPDSGTARCDFPGGSADELFNSIQRLYREMDLEVFYFNNTQDSSQNCDTSSRNAPIAINSSAAAASMTPICSGLPIARPMIPSDHW